MASAHAKGLRSHPTFAGLPVLGRFALLLSACAVTATLVAQQPAGTGARPVLIHASVMDAGGQVVRDLDSIHFEVREGRRRWPIERVRPATGPVSLVVMTDKSGSMTMNYDLSRRVAEDLVTALTPANRLRLGWFSSQIILSPAFSRDTAELVASLRGSNYFNNPSRLFDAAATAIDALRGESGRRAAIVLSDGDDLTSDMSFKRVVEVAFDEHVSITGVAFRPQTPFGPRDLGVDLKNLVEETGGTYIEAKNNQPAAVTTHVVSWLASQHEFTFNESASDGKLHDFEIVTDRKGLMVIAPRKYRASR